MALNLQSDDKYDPDKMVKFAKIPIWKRMLVRAMAPLMIPVIMLEGLMTKVLVNPLHDGKRNLSGVKKCVISDLFSFSEIKDASR